jgi:hypothetical protein
MSLRQPVKYLTGMVSPKNSQRLHHNDVVIKGHNNTKRECFHECESWQQDKVQRMAMAFPIEQAKIDECTEQGDIERPDATIQCQWGKEWAMSNVILTVLGPT